MWWSDRHSAVGRAGNRIARLAATLGVAACAGGCFQPLYADRSLDGSAVAGPGLRGALGAVDVKEIDAGKGTDEARLAVEIRNALIFDLTGGGPAPRPAYGLV